MTTPILFPGLGLEFTIDPIAVVLFGKPIYWYGIIIACGFLLGLMLACHLGKKLGPKPDDLIDMMLYAVPAAIIGARSYYVLFYRELYIDPDGTFNWARAIAVWDGGIAIYGGIIGAVIASVLFCRWKKLPFLPVADCFSCGLLLGQLMGRWGNFINQEAYGGTCTAPWRMGIQAAGEYIEVHPTFLYESLWNLLGLLLIYFLLQPRRVFDGQMALSYVLWYGLGRFWIEGMRTDSLYFFGTGLRVSQILAAVSAIAALAAILWKLNKQRSHPVPLYTQQAAQSQQGTDTEEIKE